MDIKQLCRECSELFGESLGNFISNKPLYDPEYWYQKEYHETLASLEVAACYGCPVCTLLLRQLEMKIWETREENHIDYRNHSGIHIDEAKIMVAQADTYPDHGPKIRYISVSLGLQANIPDASTVKKTGRWELSVELHLDAFTPLALAIPMESSTGSASAFTLIRQWLECCTTKHSSCNSEPGSISSYPTRLLAVHQGQLKLVETKDLVKLPAYFTLSHCWGNIEILKLTRENIQDFRHGIPEDNFCKTFKDALYITRTLRFQYLWIDSLCIIQNDVEDWRNEAAKMSGVYGGSSLNLAASAASDGRVGCFSSRNDAELQRTAHYQIQCMKDSKLRTFNCIDPTLYASCIQNCPLNQRGWTFQERFLSPRTLHFTKLQLYWECRANIACEMYQEALPHFIQNGSFGFMERSDVKGAWARAVSHYSARKLTFKQDRLPAIAGVARWVHNQTGDEYVAGLWKKHLETQLLWKVYGRGLPQPYLGIVPSWSWASLDCRIVPFNFDAEVDGDKEAFLFSRVVNIELSFKCHDPYGEVVSGRLEIRTGSLVGVQTFVDVGPIFLNQGKAGFKLIFDSKESGRARGFWYCLPIRRFCRVPTDSTIQGLILKAVPGAINGLFWRAGTFVSYPETEFSIDAAMEDSKCWADESVYKGNAGANDSGKPEYYITLV